MISEVSNCRECQASKGWLGIYSTKEKIRESGLWQVNELYREGFTNGEFSDLVAKFIKKLLSD